jgi:hypothetical protein
VNILVRRRGTETERRKQESAAQIRRHYYNREIRDGTRMRLPPNTTKEQIKKLYAERDT